MNKTTIDEINVIPVKPNNGLIAFASCVIDNKFYIGNIGIITRPNNQGIRLVYPNKKVGEQFIDCVHPINKNVSSLIENAILSKCKDLIPSYF